MAEQTNFYAVQREALRSFKPVSDGVINLYHYNYINIHRQWEKARDNFLMFSMLNSFAMNSVFARFQDKIHNIKKTNKQEKAHCHIVR